MATTHASDTQLAGKLAAVTRRLEHLAHQVDALAGHARELDDLKAEVGKLKSELEEMQEGA